MWTAYQLLAFAVLKNVAEFWDNKMTYCGCNIYYKTETTMKKVPIALESQNANAGVTKSLTSFAM
jgi:hypothetical protein